MDREEVVTIADCCEAFDGKLLDTPTKGRWRVRCEQHQAVAALTLTLENEPERAHALFLELHVDDEVSVEKLENALIRWIETDSKLRPRLAVFNASSGTLEEFGRYIVE